MGEGHSDRRERRGGGNSFLETEQVSPGAHPQDRHSCLPLSEPLLAPSLFLVFCGVTLSSKFAGDVAAAGLGLLLEKLGLKESCWSRARVSSGQPGCPWLRSPHACTLCSLVVQTSTLSGCLTSLRSGHSYVGTRSQG